jgi:uncharacterized protein YjbI with pentapeptide repeats
MNTLETRWNDDPNFQFVRMMLLDSSVQPLGMTQKEWYANVAPKTFHLIENESLDCRAMNLDGLTIEKEFFGYVLDYSKARGCKFVGTHFQGASALHFDFTGSHFIEAQMSPFYAPQAIFRDCVFNTCFLMGIGPRNYSKGAFSDFRECDFTKVDARKVYFERCDLRGARFTNGKFRQCTFFQSDLRGVEFSKTRFEACDFTEAQLDDSPPLRELVQQGGNTGLELINWHS